MNSPFKGYWSLITAIPHGGAIIWHLRNDNGNGLRHLVLLKIHFLNDNEDEGLMGLFRKEVSKRLVCYHDLRVNLTSLRGHKT